MFNNKHFLSETEKLGVFPMSRKINFIAMKELTKKIQELEAQKIERLDLNVIKGGWMYCVTCSPSGNNPNDKDSDSWLDQQ